MDSQRLVDCAPRALSHVDEATSSQPSLNQAYRGRVPYLRLTSRARTRATPAAANSAKASQR
jgi:hypothetical protein